MDILPQELYDAIAGLCTFSDLKSLRLTNSKLLHAATPLVFEDFYTALFPQHLEKLFLVARSPKLAECVKRVTVWGELLPDWTRREWEQAIDFRPRYTDWRDDAEARIKSRCSCRNLTDLCQARCSACDVRCGQLSNQYGQLARHHLCKDQLDTAWSAYKHMRHGQWNWREDVEGLMFQEAFARLPNVELAAVSLATPSTSPANYYPVWKGLRDRIMVGPDNWKRTKGYVLGRFAVGINDLVDSESDTAASDNGNDLAEEVDNEHPARDMSQNNPVHGKAGVTLLASVGFRANFAGVNHVKEINIQDTYLESYAVNLLSTISGRQSASGSVFTSPELAVRYEIMLDGVRNLTVLQLEIPNANGRRDREVRTFLSAARHLKRLRVIYNDDNSDGAPIALSQFPFMDIHGVPMYWPHLECLVLCTNIDDVAFLSFLRRHSETLKALEMLDMVVMDARQVLEKIPKIVQLEKVYLECLWSGPLQNDSVAPGNWALNAENYYSFFEEGTDYNSDYARQVRNFLLGTSKTLPTFCPLTEDAEE